MSLYHELKRRNVFRVAIAYLALAWLVTEVAGTLFPVFGIPDWGIRFLVIVFALGFVPALIISWVYELTPEGLKREKDVVRDESITHLTAKRLDVFTIGLIVVAFAFILADRLWLSPRFAQQKAAPAEIVSGNVQTSESEPIEPQYPPNSIAVLPLVNMSDDASNEYFSDGISEELLNLLAKMTELRVISRSSSFYYKGRDVKLADMARELNVAYILEGSVRKAGNRVRITAQLIEARSDFHLWSESYDRELGDIFAIQDEIAAAISTALKVKLLVDPATGEAVQPTSIKAANTTAYDAYLQGRELIRLRGERNLEDAIRHLERSLRLDETFAPAHAHLAVATILLFYYGTPTLEETRRKAVPHLDRAQELAPELAEAHAGRALLARACGDPEFAIEHAQKALASNPSYSDAMHWKYMALPQLGRYEEQGVTIKQIQVTDPMNIAGRHNYSWWLGASGRFGEARENADQLLVQSPRFGYGAHVNISYMQGSVAEHLSWGIKGRAEDDDSYFTADLVMPFTWVGEYDEARRVDDDLTYLVDNAEGRVDEAIRASQRIMNERPDDPEAIAAAAMVLYYAGRIDEALTLFERLRDIAPEGRPILGDVLFIMNSWPDEMTMRLAFARREAGDETGAQAAAQIVREDQVARSAAGRKGHGEDRTKAMMAAFEHHPEGVITALESAIEHGHRDPQFFDDPIFKDLRDEPRFVALQQELDTILAREHDKVLQLICFNNPTPHNWQPLPETCEGVDSL